jgi:hypothetical protein
VGDNAQLDGPQDHRYRDDYISESRVRYPDGSVWHAVDIFHFRDGRIRAQVAYFAPTLEAAEWRARWVERF